MHPFAPFAAGLSARKRDAQRDSVLKPGAAPSHGAGGRLASRCRRRPRIHRKWRGQTHFGSLGFFFQAHAQVEGPQILDLILPSSRYQRLPHLA